jgi:hypothetical protein
MEKGNDLVTRLITVADHIDPNLGMLIEHGIEFVPYLSKVYNFVKFNRLARRVEQHSDQLKRISQLSAETSLPAAYIQERIFPIVFADLLEEHEDAKINLILTGFENVFIEENSNESIVINYFDTLRSLRYADIKRLLYLSGLTDSFPMYSLESEEYAHLRSIDAKLENLNLVGFKKKFGEFSGEEYEVRKEEVKTKRYGKRFLKFILEDLKEHQAES